MILNAILLTKSVKKSMTEIMVFANYALNVMGKRFLGRIFMLTIYKHTQTGEKQLLAMAKWLALSVI